MHAALPGILALIGATLVASCGASDSRRKAIPAEAGADGSGDTGTGGADGAGGKGAGGKGAGGGAGDVDAGSGGAGPDDASDGDAVAPDGDAAAGQSLFVSPTGDDGAAGTREAPLLTIEHAASIAESGDVIVLLAGTFDETTEPAFDGNAITIPDGVTVASDEPQQARLVGNAGAFTFTGSGGVDGVVFEGFDVALRASTGTLTLTGVAFPDCGATLAPIVLDGDVHAMLRPGAVTNYVSADTYRFVLVMGTAELTVEGGAISGMTAGIQNGGGAVQSLEQATVMLDGVTFADNAMESVYAGGQSMMVLRDVTIERTVNPASAAIELQDTSSLTFANSRILDGYWAGVSLIGGPTATFTGCEISGNGAWGIITNAPGPATVTVTDCTFEANTNPAIETRTSTSLTVTDSRFLDGESYGLFIGAGASLRLRGTRVSGHPQGGVYLINGGTGDADLGTVSEPGGNTLLGIGPANGAAVRVGGTLEAYAVGNTWTPSVQGANAQGRYTATGAGAVNTETYPGATPSGENYHLMQDGATLRLAENP